MGQRFLPARQIAERRGVSFDAVKFHIDNAISKLGVSDRRVLRSWFRVPKESALSAQAGAADAPTALGQISR